MGLFRREPTIPLAFYEAQVKLWATERADLLNRIQHPAHITPADSVVRGAQAPAEPEPPIQPLSAYSPEEERELALVGSIQYGPEEGGSDPATTTGD